MDPARIASDVLGGASMLGGARGVAGKLLSGATKGLLGIDAVDQEIPFVGEISDGLTVAAGVGSLIASAFEGMGGSDPAPPKVEQSATVGGSFGV
mgnify:FL=1